MFIKEMVGRRLLLSQTGVWVIVESNSYGFTFLSNYAELSHPRLCFGGEVEMGNVKIHWMKWSKA